MFCDPILRRILCGLLHAIKHEKIVLLFEYTEGHPRRNGLLKKVQATEKAAEGMWAVLQGYSSELAQEGFLEMVQALDAIAPKLDPEELQGLYEERTMLLTTLEKLKHLDDILALPDGADVVEEVEDQEDEDPGDRKSQLN